MHILGHSFSQKRKGSKRPRDLHIRKVSFSGSSASGCSLSSSDSTVSGISACTAFIPPQHADHAPPRLHDRPLKTTPRRPSFDSVAFYDDDIDADGDSMISDGDDEADGEGDDGLSLSHFDMEMPPHATADDHSGHERQEPVDYFAFQLARRPPMPRSRWSESTIQSVQSISNIPTPGSMVSTAVSEQSEDVAPPVKVEVPPNYSYNFGKRAISTPNVASPAMASPGGSGRRPPLRTMDTVEEFVKRGGWKRRGIIFHQEEISSRASYAE